MKDFGSVALGSSSARKYLRTCESCFQKLSVSYPRALRVSQSCAVAVCIEKSPVYAYLEFGMAFVDEDVGGLEL
jgi:hypothetical protein